MWRASELRRRLIPGTGTLLALVLAAGATQAAPLPDLTVAEARLDSDCRVVVTLANRGPGAVPATAWRGGAGRGVVLRVQVEGARRVDIPLARLDPGQRLRQAGSRVRATTEIRLASAAAVTLNVDATRRVREGNETNNRLTRRLNCTAAPGALREAPPPSTPSPPPRAGEDPPAEPPVEADDGGDPPSAGGDGSLLDAAVPEAPDLALPRADAGDDFEPGELLVISADMAAARALAEAAGELGLRVRRRRILKALGAVVTVFSVPASLGVGEAREALRQRLPAAMRDNVDANHRYRLQGDEAATTYPRRLIKWSATPGCGRGLRLGMLDTGVDAGHPSLRDAAVTQRNFVTPGRPRAKKHHGTAVASLLVGGGKGRVAGLLPGAHLYAAEVFRRRDGEQVDTTAEWLLYALDWLAAQEVQVINISIGGTRNRPLEKALARLLARGISIAAAAGNGGEDAPPVYPAAQPGIVAVTAVDAAGRIWRRAPKGDYVDMAAPGVDVWAARPGGGYAFQSGTSFATPFVSAALALYHRRAGAGRAAVEALRREVRDLGPPGRDPRFGWGLLHVSMTCNQ